RHPRIRSPARRARPVPDSRRRGEGRHAHQPRGPRAARGARGGARVRCALRGRGARRARRRARPAGLRRSLRPARGVEGARRERARVRERLARRGRPERSTARGEYRAVIVEVLIKSLFILLVVVAALAPVITWIERKQSAVMQDRIGANRADISGITVLGLLHPLADVIKLLSKEDVVPIGANRVMPLLAPLVASAPAVVAFAVIPFGGVYTFGERTISLVAANPDWGLLYIFALGSIATHVTHD